MDKTDKKDFSHLCILVVEDNKVNQLLVKGILKKFGFSKIDSADDGPDAFRKLDDTCYDLILMDIQMPGMDGLTATNQIRGRELTSGRRRTPIVALTANAMSHQVEQYAAAGMDGHVAKPIEAAALFEVICTVTAERDSGVEPAAAVA